MPIDAAASAFRTTPIPRRGDAFVDHGVPGFAMPGSRVWAKGWFGGERVWFVATVVKLRVGAPRIHVAFEADAEGNTNKIALPPLSAYVHPADVAEL